MKIEECWEGRPVHLFTTTSPVMYVRNPLSSVDRVRVVDRLGSGDALVQYALVDPVHLLPAESCDVEVMARSVSEQILREHFGALPGGDGTYVEGATYLDGAEDVVGAIMSLYSNGGEDEHPVLKALRLEGMEPQGESRESAAVTAQGDPVVYDREVLVEVLVYHWRTKTSGCGCGWAKLGASHPEHVADAYEQAVRAAR